VHEQFDGSTFTGSVNEAGTRDGVGFMKHPDGVYTKCVWKNGAVDASQTIFSCVPRGSAPASLTAMASEHVGAQFLVMYRPPTTALGVELSKCDKYHGTLTSFGEPYIGRMIRANGVVQEGTFEKGVLDCEKGTERYADGRLYRGGFVQGKRDGPGIMTMGDGGYFHGDFEKGRLKEGVRFIGRASPRYYIGVYDDANSFVRGVYYSVSARQLLGGNFRAGMPRGVVIVRDAQGNWSEIDVAKNRRIAIDSHVGETCVRNMGLREYWLKAQELFEKTEAARAL
jgi:hypothetical protein